MVRFSVWGVRVRIRNAVSGFWWWRVVFRAGLPFPENGRSMITGAAFGRKQTQNFGQDRGIHRMG
jgi:hypothetical protein